MLCADGKRSESHRNRRLPSGWHAKLAMCARGPTGKRMIMMTTAPTTPAAHTRVCVCVCMEMRQQHHQNTHFHRQVPQRLPSERLPKSAKVYLTGLLQFAHMHPIDGWVDFQPLPHPPPPPPSIRQPPSRSLSGAEQNVHSLTNFESTKLAKQRAR